MKHKLNLQPKQNTNLKFKVIAGASSIVLLIVAVLFVINTGNVRSSFAASSKNVITTVKDGNWSDKTVWSGGVVPTSNSSDSIVVLNKINFNTDFTVGDNSKTGIYIGATGSLVGTSHTLSLQKSASLVNAGTLNIKQLNFYGNGSTDPASNVTNSGAMTVVYGISSTNPSTAITNSGSLSSGYDVTINGILMNSGIITINGKFTSNNGTITNSDSIVVSSTGTLNGAVIQNNTLALFSFGSSLTMNSGSNSAVPSIINNGNMIVSASGTKGTLTINTGSITNGSKYVASNGASFNLNGTLKINGGSGSDTISILNNGNFTIAKSATVYAVTNITDNDSMAIGGSFTNYANLLVTKMAYLGIGGNFYNDYGTNAGTTINDGYIQVSGDFTNNWNAVFTGNGGGISIANNFVNHSTITGTVDVCDKTPNRSSDNSGSMNSTVTTCSFVPYATGPSALPVELTAFTAKNFGLEVQLKWTTASEINNARFEIERSENGFDFSVIGAVKGNGTKSTPTDYAYSDENPLNGIAYYRLHQFDFNGKSDYSPIAVVHSNTTPATALDINVFPNPAQAGGSLKLEMNVPVSEMMDMEMVNMTGVPVFRNESQAFSGMQTKEVMLPGNMKEGIYLLRITYQGTVTTKKIQVKG